MLFADSGSGRPLSFITYGSFLDGIAGPGIAHGGETLHIDATGATTGQVFSYTGDGTTLSFAWVDPASGGGGGTDDQTAIEVPVDTSNFSQNLTSSDDTVQAALETIDGFSQYQGAWQQTSWPGRGNRHAQRYRLYLAGQQQYADSYPGINAMVRAARGLHL